MKKKKLKKIHRFSLLYLSEFIVIHSFFHPFLKLFPIHIYIYIHSCFCFNLSFSQLFCFSQYLCFSYIPMLVCLFLYLFFTLINQGKSCIYTHTSQHSNNRNKCRTTVYLFYHSKQNIYFPEPMRKLS